MENEITALITELADTRAEDLSITRLQSILMNAPSECTTIGCDTNDPLWKLSVQWLHIQHQFFKTCIVRKRDSNNEGDSESDMISLRRQMLFVSAVDRIRQFTLNLYLPEELRGLTKCELKMMIQLEPEERTRRLRFCLDAYRKMFEFDTVTMQSKLENCVMEYMAGVFSYYDSVNDSRYMEDNDLFQSFSLLPLGVVFKSLLVIKGVQNLATETAKRIHFHLLRLTGEAGGFAVLCKTLLADVSSDETPMWKKSEVIARIVGSKGHTKTFYRQILQDIFSFYESSLFNDENENLQFASTCIECLRQIFLLPPAYEELRNTIREYFVGRFDQLTELRDSLSGTIVLERSQLVSGLYINYMAFSGSSCTSLNSTILMPYLQIFLKLYSMLPVDAEERKYLQTLIVFCLSNRAKPELSPVLEALLLGMDEATLLKKFHPRIYLKKIESSETYSLQVGPCQDDLAEEDDLGPYLVEVLKVSNRNLLIYDVFVILLKLFERISEDADKNLLLDKEEQDASNCKRFFRKYVIIQALMELVGHRHFHSQLYENPAEVIAFLKSLLIKTIDKGSSNGDFLEIVLSIFHEYLQRLHGREDVQQILKLLKHYKTSVQCRDSLKDQIDHICKEKDAEHADGDLTPYQNAHSLCSDREPYCKVYGTTLMIRLLKERESETLSNKHAILILALNNLKGVESYAFLNSVRLLVALCDVLEADTIEALIKEYQCSDNEVDFRLKVGEAIVKTTEALGPISLKYCEQFINCFLHGYKSSVDELRSSSLSNLGNMCKILSYQVHNFFYEMFLVLKSAIETDRYLPVRRAAILVLSQLIEGMDNLLDFQDYLLAIYRFLKLIADTDEDDVTRLQATVALDHLTAKTTEFLKTALAVGKLEKDIRIFGIREQQAEERRRIQRNNDSVIAKILD
ncbi:transport and Golgi organization protein 6 [Toxorhynchites rutilus septentrionalis]|uniref:transport and Golgi organization protein 6 n=1 Tax=Toxorhynchites rutilus septentrionalis TaxID=329112 RepID=UPI00247AAF11|nr:transport and Golgi organization protein 6 [Toxorhynchites rutilus septentrionalis]XP_055638701.1 transport and Golgi organization protein 6 [Toxorhynchites rutilus septentrionalis]